MSTPAADPARTAWTCLVPGYQDKGPVTLSLRLADVTITDSEGRHIVISPVQAELIGSRMDKLYNQFGVDDEDQR